MLSYGEMNIGKIGKEYHKIMSKDDVFLLFMINIYLISLAIISFIISICIVNNLSWKLHIFSYTLALIVVCMWEVFYKNEFKEYVENPW